MPRRSKVRGRPKAVTVLGLTAHAIRRPGKRDPDRWYWRAREMRDGAQVDVLTGRYTREEVGAALMAVFTAPVVHEVEEQADQILTVGQLIRAWLHSDVVGRVEQSTEGTIRSALRRIDACVGTMRISRRNAVAQELAAVLVSNGRKSSTIGKMISRLRQAWRWAKDQDLVEVDPPAFPRLPKDAQRVVYVPTVGEVIEVASRLSSPKREILIVQLACGGRIGEVCRLEGEDVVWVPVLCRPYEGIDRRPEDQCWHGDGVSKPVLGVCAAVVQVCRGEATAEATACSPEPTRPVVWLGRHEGDRKTGARAVPVTMPAAISILRELGGQGGRIWRTRKGDPVSSKYKKSFVTTIGSVDFAALNQPRWTSHALRYLSANQLRRQGAPVEVAAKILGHTVAVMMKTYRQVDSVEVDRAMTRAQLGLSDRDAGQPVLRVLG